MDKVSLYIHIPFCTRKCPYCAFYSVPIVGCDVSAYIDALKKELNTYPLDPAVIHTIYIGGGSPSALDFDVLKELVSYFSAKFPDYQEFTVECNPAQVTFETFKMLRSSGVNRVSIGAQSFNQAELDLLGRPYQVADIHKAYESARREGFANISLDLIFALPQSSIESWEKSVKQAVSLEPEHISAYSLSFDEGSVFHAKCEKGELRQVDQELDSRMYELAICEFELAGINQYEISNFAKPGYECQHNLSYWYNRNYLGIGAAAGSWYQNVRKENVASVSEYINRINKDKNPAAYENTPDNETLARETAVLMLGLRRGIDIEYFKKHTGINPVEFFAEEIEQNQKKGLIKKEGNYLRLTKKAIPVANSVLCDFV